VNDQTDSQLLRAYAEQGSEPAFSELVRRRMDLVYSAALRMVCDSHLAQDVTQGVFVALAKNASQLAGHPVLSGWLHRTTQNIAAQTVRTDVRRRHREQEASAMKELLATGPDATWEEIAPHLDAALGDLSEPDRDAVMLRYFEHKSAREIGQVLGISDEAAQKRVNRAVDRLRDAFAERGVAVGASGMVLLISTHAVQAAPAGLALTVTTTVLSSASSVAAATTIQTITMTTFQKIAVTTALTAAIGAFLYEARQSADLREQNHAYRQQQTVLEGQVQELQRERDAANKRQALISGELAALKKTQNDTEVLRLRGQVGVLREEKDTIGKKSPLNKLTADPATRKIMREQQKMGMKVLFGDLAKNLNLEPEATEQFNDLLADHVMDSIDLITLALHDKSPRSEIDRMFAAQDAALENKLLALVGQDGLNQFRDYSKNIASTLTTQQFASNFTGDNEVKAAKKQQFLKALKEETQVALTAAGLPADYQTVPMLNFRNIASEQQAETSLKLLDDIYGRVAGRAQNFLDDTELGKFQEFRAKAQENSRSVLLMNRKMMAPIVQ
jgi:RNA polymerase sigma factor (sigma-70 family)